MLLLGAALLSGCAGSADPDTHAPPTGGPHASDAGAADLPRYDLGGTADQWPLWPDSAPEGTADARATTDSTIKGDAKRSPDSRVPQPTPDARRPDARVAPDSGVVWAPLPGNGLTADSPSAVLDANGALHLVVRGVGNNKIWHNVRRTSGWSGWNELPGGKTTTSALGVTVDSTGGVRVYARLANNEIWETRYAYSYWASWKQIPDGKTLDAPAAVTDGTTIRLFVRGVDSDVYQTSSTTTGWATWTKVPGAKDVASGLAVTRSSTGTIRIVARDWNSDLVENRLTGTTWSGWTTIAGVKTLGRPGMLRASSGMTYLFVRGQNDALWKSSTYGTTWSTWQQLGDVNRLSSGPAVVPEGNDLMILARGLDDRLYTFLY
ncbi:MAG: hypothetical protein IT371_25100 [Deltaproteobacteria bacterium]|nr:hypothetical protein [Deltaproteobacteria bacterium]